MRRSHLVFGGTASALAGLTPLPAWTQAFPAKQIHLVVPTSAGGVHDVIGRIWADRVKSSLGTIVVENRAGGGASIGLNYVAQMPADGHTLMVGSTSTLVLREGGSNRAYDAAKDIRAVSIVATTSTSIAVHPSLPVKSVINDVTQKEWADKEFQKKLIESGFEPMLGFGPDPGDRYLHEESAKWNPMVQKVQGQ